MGLTAIQARLFNTKVNIERRTNSADSVGDFNSVWNDINSNVPASVQPIRVDEKIGTQGASKPQGKEYRADSKAYIPLEGLVEPLNGDRLFDTETGKTYNIVGVETWKASRIDIALGHHYKLLLEIPRSAKS